MTATRLLHAFLASAFPGLSLRPAGDSDWPSLRFELGDEVPVSRAKERAAQAARRAATVFEAAFGTEDQGFLTFTRWDAEDDALFVPLLPADVSERLERVAGNDFYDAGDDDRYVAYTVAVKPRAVAYEPLFRLVANCELGEMPSVSGRAYFVNRTHPYVFHMYDDRGALLIARDAGDLDVVREAFSAWLVPQ